MNDSQQAEKQPVKRDKCPYGFDCSSFMLIAGTIAHDCENLGECKQLARARGVDWAERNQETFEIVMYYADDVAEREERERRWAAEYAERQQRQEVWREENRRIRLVIQIRQHEAATLMLKTRGNHQDYSNFEIDELAAQISETLDSFFNELEQLATNDNGYISPDGVEAHIYNVKRPSRTEFPAHWSLREVRAMQSIFHYHKLTSKLSQFVAVGKDKEGNPKTTKVIHTSKSEDARNIQSRLGIERRNKLNKIRTRLLTARQALTEAVAIAQEEYSYEDILLQSREAANELDEAELQADAQQNS